MLPNDVLQDRLGEKEEKYATATATFIHDIVIAEFPAHQLGTNEAK